MASRDHVKPVIGMGNGMAIIGTSQDCWGLGRLLTSLKSQGYPRPEQAGVFSARNKCGTWVVEKEGYRKKYPRVSIVSVTRVYRRSKQDTQT